MTVAGAVLAVICQEGPVSFLSCGNHHLATPRTFQFGFILTAGRLVKVAASYTR